MTVVATLHTHMVVETVEAPGLPAVPADEPVVHVALHHLAQLPQRHPWEENGLTLDGRGLGAQLAVHALQVVVGLDVTTVAARQGLVRVQPVGPRAVGLATRGGPAGAGAGGRGRQCRGGRDRRGPSADAWGECDSGSGGGGGSSAGTVAGVTAEHTDLIVEAHLEAALLVTIVAYEAILQPALHRLAQLLQRNIRQSHCAALQGHGLFAQVLAGSSDAGVGLEFTAGSARHRAALVQPVGPGAAGLAGCGATTRGQEWRRACEARGARDWGGA